MRLEAAITGSLKQAMAEEIKGAEHAVTSGVREAAQGLKTELRAQITSAGLGQRLANTWRAEIYPKGQMSIGAAGLVWSKAPGIVRIYEEGATIRSTKGLFLAIPTLAAGRYGDGSKKITPTSWERRTGLRLRFVYRRGGPSLLIADEVRLTSRGRVAPIRSARSRAARVTVPIFVLVPQVTFRKRLDVAGAARRWIAELPARVLQHWQSETR